MVFSFNPAKRDPDRADLQHMGKIVRARLDAEPAAYRLPVDGIEIYAVADFLPAADCKKLIRLVDKVARPSPTYNNNTDGGRTSYTGDLNPDDPVVAAVRRRIDDLLGLDPALGEPVQGQRYSVGQEFKHHFDYFVTSHDYWNTERGRGGQRTWTAMAFLNAVDEGGATDFPKVDLTIAPRAGVLLVWNNMAADGRPNPRTLHAGTPVLRGTKYVLTRWYRVHPWS